MKGLAAFSGLVCCDHQHVIPFMNSSRDILKPFAAVGLSVPATLVRIIKDVYYQEPERWVSYLKNMFLMAKTCRKSFKRLGN